MEEFVDDLSGTQKCGCSNSAVVPGPIFFISLYGLGYCKHDKGKMNCKVSAPRQYGDSQRKSYSVFSQLSVQ